MSTDDKPKPEFTVTFVPARRCSDPHSDTREWKTVSPMIFSIELSPWPAAQESGELVDPRCALLPAIYRLEGAPYLLGNPVFFGFRRLPTPEALRRARTARRECAEYAPDDVDVVLSCSTVALKECTEVLTQPWDFLRTDELRDALTKGLSLYRMEPI